MDRQVDALASRIRSRIFDEHHEAVGRGPTPEASREAAEKRWVEELPAR
jgi:hypothetical protein